MKIIKSVKALTDWRNRVGDLEKIAFVPTMGALHEGHLALIRAAKKKAKIVVVSIYVNPYQFNSKFDFENYPKRIAEDIELLRKECVDIVFLPDDKDIYGVERKSFFTFNIDASLENVLCGKKRKGHFSGVALVVLKLFLILRPSIAFFGLKDYQQCKIVEALNREFFLGIKLIFAKTIRAKNGLALSSRNMLLSFEEREKIAPQIFSALIWGKKLILGGEKDPRKIIKSIEKRLSNFRISVDYLEIINADTLVPINVLKGKILLAGAFFIGKVRLIDSILIEI